MFTGIIPAMGTVTALDLAPAVSRLRVEVGDLAAELRVGDSLAVNGCCLTVVDVAGGVAAFDLHPETLEKTRFAERLRAGARVNLEPPLRVGDRLHGHFVQGHVDGVGTVTAMDRSDEALRMLVSLPRDLSRYVAPKGSIAIEGVSLTCAAVGDDDVTIAVIPHTASITTLGGLRVGDFVNVEVDILAKYVERMAAAR